MKTKKFEGKTEQEALEKVRDELGLSAIVLSIKKKSAKGLSGLFKKPTIVVTAAYDENEAEKDKVLAAAMEAAQAARKNGPALPDTLSFPAPAPFSDNINTIQSDVKDSKIAQQQQVIQQLEHKVQATEEMLARVMGQLSDSGQMMQSTQKYQNTMLQMFYDSLVAQGVSPEIADIVLEEANALEVGNEQQDINLVVKIVYNKIMSILGEPRTIVGENNNKVVVFMGPTGVGKTTTIAKLSSILLLNYQKKVGLITADTYRIAAVDQLRTYADILGLDLRVIYNANEVMPTIEQMKDIHDIILVDTAGRSHKNTDNVSELRSMLEFIPDSSKYLVLSVTTRQEDILNIISAYEGIADFDLIFTKLDETGSLGILLNVCYLTGKRVSYTSFGQNVPEDIEKIKPDKIAKALMGKGFDNANWGRLD